MNLANIVFAIPMLTGELLPRFESEHIVGFDLRLPPSHAHAPDGGAP
jgi:hypothetical protein